MALDLASWKDVRLGLLKPRHFDWALNRFGGFGYGLVGEAILERVGCSYLYEPHHAEDIQAGLAERARGVLRTWLSRQLPVSVNAATN
jgi:hypothetical protein